MNEKMEKLNVKLEKSNERLGKLDEKRKSLISEIELLQKEITQLETQEKASILDNTVILLNKSGISFEDIKKAIENKDFLSLQEQVENTQDKLQSINTTVDNPKDISTK